MLLMPGSGLLEMLMAAGQTLAPGSPTAQALCAVSLSAPLVLDTRLQLIGQVKVDSLQGQVEALSCTEAGRSQLHCSGRLLQAAAVKGDA